MAQTITREQRSARPTSFGLTLGGVWLIVVLLLIYMFNALLPQPPNDFWWHMAVGRLIAQNGSVPTTNMWAYTLPADAPYYYQSWLGSYLMYQLWQWGDVPLMLWARSVVVVVSYGLLGWYAARRADSARAAAFALLVGALLGMGNWFLRPQTLALLPFALTVVLCDAYRNQGLHARWLLLLPPLLALWVNLHGSFVAGLVVIGLSVAGEGLRLLVRRPQALPARRWALFAGAGALAGTATLLNPRGAGVFPYLGTMLNNPTLQRHFLEWQPPTNDLGNITGFCFFAALLGTAALLARSPRRVGGTDVLLFVAFGWLAIDGIRYVMWFGLLLVPLLAVHVAAATTQLVPQRFAPRRSPGLALATGSVVTAVVLLLLPWFEPVARLGGFAAAGTANSGRYASLLSGTTPVAATEWLRQHPIQGRFFPDMSYSSYTIWALPQQQVFADLRVELFPAAIWRDYFDITTGDDGALALLERWAITHLMLHRSWQRDLIDTLARDPAWQQVYADRDTVIFARRSHSTN
jgi:hypothetical protein